MQGISAGIGWGNICAMVQGGADWAGQQASIVGTKLTMWAIWFRLTESMDAEVLATINAIVAAMMVVIFSQPENIRGAIIELKRSGRVTADPADAPRIAYNEAVMISGWLCIASTLIMTVYRPGESEGQILLVVASLVTMIGCFSGTLFFLYRYVQLKVFGAGGDDQPLDALRPS